MRTVLITGANRGIGFAITKLLLEKGYQVVALSRSTENLAKMRSDKLLVYQVDLINLSKVDEVLNDLEKRKISIDVLINNAGKGIFKEIDQLMLEEWEEVIRLNLTVPYYFIHRLIPKMKEAQFGRIINIGSDADHIPYEFASAYCASKYGLLGMTESLRIELKKDNVGITTISPARVDTFFNNKEPGCRPISLKAEDVAEQVCFILEQSARCTIEQIKLSSIME